MLAPKWGKWEHANGLWRRLWTSAEEYELTQVDKMTNGYRPHQHSELLRQAVAERMAKYITPGARVLCLGARTGDEVLACRDIGAFAFGIDLWTGQANRYVVYGDMHKLDLPSACVDLIYTNAFDHARYPEQVIAEIARVLVSGGKFVLDAVDITQNPIEPKRYESFWWDQPDALLPLIVPPFELASSEPFRYPWYGLQMVFNYPLGS